MRAHTFLHRQALGGPCSRLPGVGKNGRRSVKGQAEHLGWNPCLPNVGETVKCRRMTATTRDYDESEMRFKSQCNIITLNSL